jgi:hypothetical protein
MTDLLANVILKPLLHMLDNLTPEQRVEFISGITEAYCHECGIRIGGSGWSCPCKCNNDDLRASEVRKDCIERLERLLAQGHPDDVGCVHSDYWEYWLQGIQDAIQLLRKE